MKMNFLFLTFLVISFTFFHCAEERLIDEPGNLVPLTVDQDSRLPAIKVNNALLHSEAFGHPDSTLVICIHGGPGSDYRYMLNCKQLADYGFRVVFYDQLGSGLSQRFPRQYYLNRGAEALDLFYEELSGVIAHYRTSPAQKVYLLGHSWGGMLATGYTTRHPQAVQGMVVCEPGGLKWADINTYVSSSREFSLWSELFNNLTYKDQFLSAKKDQHNVLDYQAAILTSNNKNTADLDAAENGFWRLGAVISEAMFEVGKTYEPDLSKGIEQFKLPVLFFYSSLNKVYTTLWAERVSIVYPRVELIQVPGVGHSGIVSDRSAWEKTTLPAILNYFNTL